MKILTNMVVRVSLVIGSMFMQGCATEDSKTETNVATESKDSIVIQKIVVSKSSVYQLEWQDSISLQDISLEDKIRIADYALQNCCDKDYDRYEDLAANRLLTPDLFEKDLTGNWRFVFDRTKEGRAILLTVCCSGTMCSGTSFILYKKNDGTCTVKKVAYGRMIDDGYVYPAQFRKIKKVGNNYKIYGVFAYSSCDEAKKETMTISSAFLESDEYMLK